MEFRILGPLEVIQEGRPLELGGARQRALLAILLLHANEVVSSDRLVDELWPDEPPSTGRAALRVRVSQLRKALGGAEVVITRPPGYVLSVEPEQLDLHEFERLTDEARRALEAGEPERAASLSREALALWRGSPLADVAYEAFAEAEVARLEELRLTAVERRIEADLALGRHEDLVSELEALVSQHPLREQLRGQLMLALYRSGRQAEALDVYRRGRTLLVDELGIEPSDALRQLEAAILRQDPALEPEPRLSARSILVVLGDERLLALAEPLAREPPRDLIVARLLADPASLADESRRLKRVRDELGVRTRIAVFTSFDPGADAARLAAEQDVELALVSASPAELEALLGGDLGAILESAPCDVAVLTGGGETGSGGPVLVPFAGAEHDWTAVEIAAWIARASRSTLVLAGTAADRRRKRRDASRLLASASLIVQQVAGVAAEPLLVAGGGEGVVEASRNAGLVVVGLSDRWRREGVGEARLELARSAQPPVLLVRRGVRPGGLSPPEGLTRFTWTLRPE